MEFAGKHNIGTLDASNQMESIVRGMVGKSLTYKKLVSGIDGGLH